MFIPLLLTLPAAVPAARGRTLSQHSLVPVAVAYPARGRAPGYRQVFGDRLFRRVWVLTALVVAVGYGQLHAGFPAYAAGPGGISANALGFAFAANMVVVVAAQLPVLRLVAGRRRTRVLCLACATWAGAYSLTLLGGHLGGGSLAVGGFVAAMAVFALAETLVSPTLPAIVNDIATEELRGRYNGAATLAWTTGFLTGPALAGIALDHGAGTPLFLAMIAGCALAARGALRLERYLPPAANRIRI